MKKGLIILAALLFLLATNGYAFFIDFEDGVNGAAVNDITGVSFLDFNGFDAIYGEGILYNTTSDDGGHSGTGNYHHNGEFFLWASAAADAQGVIVDFTNNDGTYFNTGYSSYSNFYLDAYLTDGSVISAMGAANLNNPMGYLNVAATSGLYLDYIVMHDTGNFWLVDDMSGDATGVNAPVPEPATFLLLGSGLAGLAWYRRKRK